MKTVKQISVFVENKPGRLSTVTRCLADANVNIRAVCMADTTDFGIFRLIVSDCEAAITALKNAGITCSVTEVIAIGVNDVPGAFADAVQLLADAGLSVEYTYAFVTPENGKAYVILHVTDNELACKVLGELTISENELV